MYAYLYTQCLNTLDDPITYIQCCSRCEWYKPWGEPVAVEGVTAAAGFGFL